MSHHSVIIIGAGIAGLTCATYLERQSVPFVMLEAAEEVGGRVRTDLVDGFQLDRGFQIFLTSYPEAKQILSYDALQFQPFRSGAIIRKEGRFLQLVNPLKEPLAAIPDLITPIGSLLDKIKILKLVAELKAKTIDEIFSQPDSRTKHFLQKYGFSEKIIQQFFQPFFGGVFLERELSTSSNFFQFVFKQFAVSDAVLPMKGIQAIPKQLVAKLPAGSIRKGIAVKLVKDNQVYLSNGEVLTADCVVMAVDATSVNKLLGKNQEYAFNDTTCVYFNAPHSPLETPMLVINSDETSLVNHVCVPSDIAPAYAPAGKSLISVNIIKPYSFGEEELIKQVRAELTQWFGEQVHTWQHLRTYSIPQALPSYTPDTQYDPRVKQSDTLYTCGDYTAYPSLNGAMQSGREVAGLVAEKIKGTLTSNR
ncbi:NAD(P)/FAD-dependent oxidoreductase [Rhodocytophaga aerolata]|uniref:NAD(P)/FAD-dependent oxidoreductase n=1 Tax=Rhodocytophaga aerolata TaxID=455078 RepID=A0ABT8RDE2_9BACT|nr:NAD(P)/FAD-dependent oxidoreductase [Rhodocytophaga aerolata]MDO1448735.1 NAD(P)/FAD-dependent oxidoreductase [Rhodocytophaga aerolata]